MTYSIMNRICLVIVALSLFLSSCLTNHGDIGYFYGQWALTSMTIDSEAADIDVSDYFLKFQNNIIEIQKMLEMHDYIITRGTWEEKDDVLWLNFTHSEGEDGDKYLDRYDPPVELGIPGREISPFEIEKLTTKDMVLRFVNAEGKVYRYVFKKLL